MIVEREKNFDRQFAKLRPAQKQRAIERMQLFIHEPNHPQLRNHELKGEWSGYRSISVGGDLRIHYKVIDEGRIAVVAVGTHSQLYK